MNHAASIHQLSSRTFLEIIRMQTEIARLGLDLGDVMAYVTERMQALTNANGAVVEFVEGEEMVYRAASGITAAHLGLRVKRTGSLCGRCVELGMVLRSDDTDIDSRVDREACRRIGVRSMIVAPLKHRGSTVGVLKVTAPTVAAFGSGDAHILELMCDLISASMFHAARYGDGDVYAKATHDSLTGLPNKALFYDRLRQSFVLAQRETTRLGILKLSLDRLEHIAGKFGPLAAEAAIKEAGARMRNTARRSDTVARVGQDEFAVILVGAGTRVDGEVHAGRLAEQVERPFEFEGNALDLCINVGMAVFPEDGDDIVKLVSRADYELDEAKQLRGPQAANAAKAMSQDGSAANTLARRAPMHQRPAASVPQRASGTYR